MKRSLFKKHSSDELVLNDVTSMNGQNGGSSDLHTTNQSQISAKKSLGSNRKQKSRTNSTTSKTIVDVIKDGNVNFISGKDLDGKKWEKGRMCLIKTVGGYLLEFYSPPKVKIVERNYSFFSFV